MVASEDIPRKGDVLAGKYQVEEILGTGGMGVVVAAWHMALRQRVALKFLLPEALKLPGAVSRFLREAQAAVAIRSEHVARVLDVGTLESGAPFMVMEHLSGVDLAHHLKEHGPLPLGEAIDFLLQAGEAIAEAHALGIVHRDLKPANLFLARRAEGSPLVKVLDFGLSRITPADGEGPAEESLTATGVVIGSPHYMSPEQMRSLKHVDVRTDVWALGVILYELLTGKRPFRGPSGAAICASVAADTPVPATSLCPTLPGAIDELIFACLEKEAARRLPTVAHFARGLSPFAPRRSEASIAHILRLLPGVRPSPEPGQALAPPASERVSVSRASPSISMPGPELVTASAGWGHTQATVPRAGAPLSERRRSLVLTCLALVLLLSAAVLAVVVSRGGHRRQVGFTATRGAALSSPHAPTLDPALTASTVVRSDPPAMPASTPTTSASAEALGMPPPAAPPSALPIATPPAAPAEEETPGSVQPPSLPRAPSRVRSPDPFDRPD